MLSLTNKSTENSCQQICTTRNIRVFFKKKENNTRWNLGPHRRMKVWEFVNMWAHKKESMSLFFLFL